MTLEHYERLCKKYSRALDVFRSWEAYKERTHGLMNTLIFSHTYQYPLEFNKMSMYDEDVYDFVDKLRALEKCAYDNMKTWEKCVNVLEAVLSTPEAKEAERLYNEEGGDSPDFRDTEELEDESISEKEWETMSANLRIKSEKERGIKE